MKTKQILQYTSVIMLCMFLNLSLFSQTTAPPKQWDKRFGGADGDQLEFLQQTTDGGYISGGYSSSGINGDKTEDSRGSNDFWVVKINANGIKQWDKRFGGSDYDALLSLQQTMDGGYILGGYSSSGIGGDKTEDSRGISDYWVVKIDANGVKQWDKRFGGTSDDFLYSLQQTNDGGYVLGGYSSSGIGGDKTVKSRGAADYWVVKSDAIGTKQWDNRFGGASDEYLNSVQQTTDGGYILGGYSRSGIGGDKTEESHGSMDYWVVKIDANGIKQWDKRFGGAGYDALNCLQQTTGGGYILGGSTDSGIGGDKTEESRGGDDYWVVKIDANGNKEWDKRFGGSSDDVLRSLAQTADGGYILGGQSQSNIEGDKTEESRGGADYWVVKIDANGMKQWDKRYGGSDYDFLYSLKQTDDAGYVFGGWSKSNIGGDKGEKCRGYYDYWVVKLGCPPAAIISPVGSTDICIKSYVILKINATDTLKYQWLRNNQKIPGAIRGYYKATTPGVYKVMVYTAASCKNISNALNVTKSCATGSSAENILSPSPLERTGVRLFPNPSKGNITVTYNSSIAATIQLNVFDITGKKLFTKTVQAVVGNNV